MIKYQDLPEERKEQERQNYREHGLGYDWWDGVYDYAKETAAKFGLDIDDISFSGFWSQGDGASYTGNLFFKECDASELPEEVRDVYRTLHEVNSLIKIAHSKEYLFAQITRDASMYTHEGSMQFDFAEDVTEEYACEILDAREKGITEALRDYARWIYRTLEKEYEHLTSDKAIDELLHDEEYENEQETNG